MKKLQKAVSVMLATLSMTAGFGFSACGEEKDGNVLMIGASDTGYGLDWLRATIAEFEKEYPEYDIRISDDSDSKFSEMAETRLKSGRTENDLLLISNIAWTEFARTGKLVDLSDVYASPFGEPEGEHTIESAMTDGARTIGLGKGKDDQYAYYTMAIDEATAGLIVNRTVTNHYEKLSSWGSTKKIDKVNTVAELNAWVKRIMTLSESNGFSYLDGSGKGAVKGFTYPGQYMVYWDSAVSTWWVQYSGYETYQNFFAMESAKVYEDLGRKKAYEAFESLNLSETSVPGSINFSHMDSQNAFVAGKSALIPNGVWIENESRGVIKDWNAEIEMRHFPAVDSTHAKKKVLYCSGSNIALVPNRKDTNVALAKKFLAFMMSYKESLRYTEITGSVRPYYAEYSAELIDDGLLSIFSENVHKLRLEADSLIYDVPQDGKTPNWQILRAGTASKLSTSQYGAIIEGRTPAATVFNNEVMKSAAEFKNWLELNNLG